MEGSEAVDIQPIIARYRESVDQEFGKRLKVWRPDFAHIQVHEVIGALLGRQATLAKEIASAPTLWNGHSAPILLRAMADVYINMAWLLLEPEGRCLKFISFGLGQAKLELEHRRSEIGGREMTAEETAAIEFQEAWIDAQRASFLQDVDLGKWAGISVRQMATEADCLDFYNYVYTPFSACAHSMWHHVGHYNLATCDNPLHRHHRCPISEDAELDVHSLTLAAKYWTKTLAAFDKKVGFETSLPSTYDALITAISALNSPSVP